MRMRIPGVSLGTPRAAPNVNEAWTRHNGTRKAVDVVKRRNINIEDLARVHGLEPSSVTIKTGGLLLQYGKTEFCLDDIVEKQATPDDPVDVDGEVSDRRMKAYQALSDTVTVLGVPQVATVVSLLGSNKIGPIKQLMAATGAETELEATTNFVLGCFALLYGIRVAQKRLDVLEAEKNMRLAEIYSKRRLKELQYVL